ncbi:transcriptional regulator [Arthrobacter crystallopoietes BAB-32]|uniref:Transcriptional regulator n=1 Tax=Arthrobacter crystallopoietes BAB-32 TaxID=1246476 RepID=N1V4H9_9MICC|nr:LysR family transcriptional regulator [Arthrobacter crystallopoietes]EMY36240.1 transcriptional regulator [Arthrobacter crystallopoietes BAB-32]
MEIRELKYFVAVAENLSFTKAAQRLQMTQPPLSQAIARLEKELGVRLFEREARQSPRLTESGTVLYAEARRILKGVEVAESLLRHTKKKKRLLRVGSISSVHSGLMPSVVRSFTEAHPEIRVLVAESEEVDVRSELRSGSLDIGFTRAGETSEGFESEFLCDEPLIAVLPIAHRLAHRNSIRLSELADDDFVTFERNDAPEAYDRILISCIRAGFHPRVPMTAKNDLAMLSTIACGVGMSLMPLVSSSLEIPGVRFVPLEEPWAFTPLSMTWLKGIDNPARDMFASAVRLELRRRQVQDLERGRRTLTM